MSTFKIFINNLVQESFNKKRKKKQLIFWQFFFISQKSDVNFFKKNKLLTNKLRAFSNIFQKLMQCVKNLEGVW